MREYNIGFWGDAITNRVKTDQNSPANSTHGYLYNAIVGYDVRIRNLLFGLAGSGEYSDFQLVTQDGYADTIGAAGTLYAAYLVNESLSVSGLASYGRTHVHQALSRSTGAVKGSNSTNRFIAALDLNVNYPITEDWTFIGSTGVHVAREVPNGYFDSTGRGIDPDSVNLGQWVISGEVGYMIDYFEPFLGAQFEYDFRLSLGSDRTGAVYRGGVRYQYSPRTVAGIEFHSMQHRSYESGYLMSLNFRYVF